METTPWMFGPGLSLLQGCTFVRHRSWPLQCKGSQLCSSVGLCSARVPNGWRCVNVRMVVRPFSVGGCETGSVTFLTLMDLPGDLHPPYCVGLPEAATVSLSLPCLLWGWPGVSMPALCSSLQYCCDGSCPILAEKPVRFRSWRPFWVRLGLISPRLVGRLAVQAPGARAFLRTGALVRLLSKLHVAVVSSCKR